MPAVPQGPSEYTRMMSTPQVPQAPQMPQMPQVPQMSLPQAPQMNVPQAPQLNMPQAPTAPPAKGISTNMLLIGIFCLLAFLAGGFIVYVLVHK